MPGLIPCTWQCLCPHGRREGVRQPSSCVSGHHLRSSVPRGQSQACKLTLAHRSYAENKSAGSKINCWLKITVEVLLILYFLRLVHRQLEPSFLNYCWVRKWQGIMGRMGNLQAGVWYLRVSNRQNRCIWCKVLTMNVHFHHEKISISDPWGQGFFPSFLKDQKENWRKDLSLT